MPNFLTYYKGTPKQKYAFWSVVVFLLSLFGFFPNPTYPCFAWPRIINVIIPNVFAQIIFYIVYFPPSGIYYLVKTKTPLKASNTLLMVILWIFKVLGLLLIIYIVFLILKSSDINVLHWLKDIGIGIAFYISSTERIKKIRSINLEDFK